MSKKLKAVLYAICTVFGVIGFIAAISIVAMYYPLATSIVALSWILLTAIFLIAYIFFDAN